MAGGVEIIELHSWTQLKSLLVSLKSPNLYYKENPDSYRLYLPTDSLIWGLTILKGTSDSYDFEQNYKNQANQTRETYVTISENGNVARVINNRLLVDTGLRGYQFNSSYGAPNLVIPRNTEYTILEVTNSRGIIEEIHINCETNKFHARVYRDKELLWSFRLSELQNTYLLTGTYSSIMTTAGTDFHYRGTGILFQTQFRIAIINFDENRRLVSYVILYKVEI